MSNIGARRERLLAAEYRAFGETSRWTSALGDAPASPVVRRIQGEQLPNFGETRVVTPTMELRARKSELAGAAERDTVEILSPDGATVIAAYRVIGRPRLDPHGYEWVCEAALLQP